MAKRARNWKPDIYDMTAGRVATSTAVETVLEPAAAPEVLEAPVTMLPTAAPVLVPVSARARPRGGDNQTLLGLVAGAVVGAALTLLVAPASGARLRAHLRAQLDTHT